MQEKSTGGVAFAQGMRESPPAGTITHYVKTVA